MHSQKVVPRSALKRSSFLSSVEAGAPNPRLVPMPKWCQGGRVTEVWNGPFNRECSNQVTWSTYQSLFPVPECEEEHATYPSENPKSFYSEIIEPSAGPKVHPEHNADLTQLALKQLAATFSTSGLQTKSEQMHQELTPETRQDQRFYRENMEPPARSRVQGEQEYNLTQLALKQLAATLSTSGLQTKSEQMHQELTPETRQDQRFYRENMEPPSRSRVQGEQEYNLTQLALKQLAATFSTSGLQTKSEQMHQKLTPKSCQDPRFYFENMETLAGSRVQPEQEVDLTWITLKLLADKFRTSGLQPKAEQMDQGLTPTGHQDSHCYPENMGPSAHNGVQHEQESDFSWHALKQLAGKSIISESQPRSELVDQELTSRSYRSPELQLARNAAAAGLGLSGYATVMIKHVPYSYTQKKFLSEINKDGFRGTFDFLYLPSDSRTSRGFGFINFLSATKAEEFYHKYNGQRLKHGAAPVLLAVIPADVQGFEQSATCYFSSWQFRKGRSNFAPLFLKPVPGIRGIESVGTSTTPASRT